MNKWEKTPLGMTIHDAATFEKVATVAKIADADEMDRRAALIAAAPDLLRVAIGAAAFLGALPRRHRPDKAWMAPLLEAIAQAGGKAGLPSLSPQQECAALQSRHDQMKLQRDVLKMHLTEVLEAVAACPHTTPMLSARSALARMDDPLWGKP